jgi:Motility quorum-sensing regulator, toxin of MqsA
MGRAEALARAHELAAVGAMVILRNPQQDMENLGYDFDDVADCIQSCRLEDVEKDMEDLYRDAVVLVFKAIPYGEDDLYVKISVPTNAADKLNVLSFKYWGSPR